MEHQIQNILSCTFDQNLNPEDEDVIINKLFKICFKDSLKQEQIYFLSSQIINSDHSLFRFLESRGGDKNRKSTGFKGKIIDFLKEFAINFSENCKGYLEFIKESSIKIYLSDQGAAVKEKIFSFLAKLVEINQKEIVEKVFKPQKFLEFLLDEIRLKKLTGGVKGYIWIIIGVLISKFSFELNEFKVEIHDVLFHELKFQLQDSKKLDLKAVAGILKSYIFLLEDPILNEEQINSLYIFLKSMIKPLPDTNSIKINKNALEVLGTHGKVFTKQLQKDSINLFDDIFELCNHQNNELKATANEAIENISIHIADCLLEENLIHKDSFKYLLNKIKFVLGNKYTSILINTAISLIGIFAKSIVKFLGENILQQYLDELLFIFDDDVVNSIVKENEHNLESSNKRYKPSKSIKYVLSKQKQYISMLNAYSHIISNMKNITEFIHLYKILLVSFTNHSKFFEKYRERLSDGVVSIIVGMVNHQNYFWSFLKKIVKNGFLESIKLSDDTLFKEETENLSITNAVKYWIDLFSRYKIFTEFTKIKVFDQLINEIVELLSILNLNYKEVRKNIDENLESVIYQSDNMEDLEIYNRICVFIKDFIKVIDDKLINPWVIILIKKLILIGENYPRISCTYSALSSLLKKCETNNYFKNLNEHKDFFDEFENFNKNLIKMLEMFQDDLLLKAIEFLLSVPTKILKQIYLNNINVLKKIFKRALEIGYNDYRYAKLALNCLKSWIKDDNIDNRFNEIMNEILPIFGDYLIEYQKIKNSIHGSNLDINEKFKKVQNKIFKILGELGGDAHNIIEEKKIKSNNILSLVNSKSIEYSLPLYNKKYNIYFDNIIPKIADIALFSFIKDKKYAAAELLHSIILYIIGLETIKSDVEIGNVMVFLIEKVLHLSCDLEKSISKIFEPLLYQIIHWIAKKGSSNNNKEILSILDILIENSSAHQNLKIREISSKCAAEYIKWFLKQHSDLTIKEKNSTIKYLIRTIESNAQHPDPFKRLGAVMCFDKIIVEICQSDTLIDKFAIEITSYCFAVLKITFNSKELQEIIFNIVNSVNKLLKQDN